MNVAKPQLDLIPTRGSLLSRLRDWGDQESWRDFFHSYWRLIYEVALKAGLSDAEAQEVVQETVISVAKQMPGFRYDPARGQVQRLAAANHPPAHCRPGAQADAGQRRRGVVIRSRRCTPEQIESVLDPAGSGLEAIWAEEWERHLLQRGGREHQEAGQARSITSCSTCTWFRNGRCARSRIRSGVNAGQVYLAKHRISSLLKKEIARLEKELPEGL